MNSSREQSETQEPNCFLLSIIIVNWNTRELLQECLESITQHLGGSLRAQTEIIVVDNGSVDRSAQMIRENYSSVRLISNGENLGFARANNQGIEASAGKYILLLNSDAKVVTSALERMVACLDSEAEVGIVGICLIFPDGRPQFCYGNFPTLWQECKPLFSLHHWDLSPWGRDTDPIEVDWVSGACLMARKKMLQDIGQLDDSFFMFGEEVDLCRRASLAGWRVCLVTKPSVIHLEAGSGKDRVERIITLYQGKLNYAAKHWGIQQANILLILMKLSIFLKFFVTQFGSVFSENLAQNRMLWSRVFKIVLIEGGIGLPFDHYSNGATG